MFPLTRLLVLYSTLLAAAPYVVVASPVSKAYHEFRRFVPTGWTPARRAEPDIVLPLRVGLAQSNLHNIETYLLDVSHPDSPNYGNHWTASRVAETFRPSDETVDIVRSWLADSVDPRRISLSRGGGWLEVNMTVDEVERLLGTEYYVYEHGDSGAEHVACKGGYELPGHVSNHVDFITPTLQFDVGPRLKRSSKVRRRASMGSKTGSKSSPLIGKPVQNVQSGTLNCNEQLTLACLRILYDFNYVPLAANKNTVGVVEYSPDHYIASDMDLFFGNFSKSQVGERPTVVAIDGGVFPEYGDSYESNLDTQYMMGLVGPKQKVQLFQVGDAVEGVTFNNFLDAIDGSYCTFEGGDSDTDAVFPDPYGGYQGPENCGTATPAFVISTSYSYTEVEFPPAYMQRQCAEYAKLGLMGTTVLYSSGDYGVAGNGDLCIDSNGAQAFFGTIFNPTFPAGCPYITSVGGTQVDPGATPTEPESAWMDLIDEAYSSGGFSNVFAIPDYQKSSVEKYLQEYPPPYASDVWNSSGSRAFPDLSANANNFGVAVFGEIVAVSGTSASSPTVGAILSAINDGRLAIGKRPIGFINPVIYSPLFRDAFNDITNGSNPGCGTAGFSAVPGWDPVTGLGTPNFRKLLEKWLALP